MPFGIDDKLTENVGKVATIIGDMTYAEGPDGHIQFVRQHSCPGAKATGLAGIIAVGAKGVMLLDEYASYPYFYGAYNKALLKITGYSQAASYTSMPGTIKVYPSYIDGASDMLNPFPMTLAPVELVKTSYEYAGNNPFLDTTAFYTVAEFQVDYIKSQYHVGFYVELPSNWAGANQLELTAALLHGPA